MISVTCPSCESRLKVGDHLAGRRVKCPKCTAIVPVAEDGMAEAVAPRPTSRSAPLDDYDDDRPLRRPRGDEDEDLDEEEERPRKKKKKKQKNQALLIGVIAGSALVVIGGAVLLIVLLSGGKDDAQQANPPQADQMARMFNKGPGMPGPPGGFPGGKPGFPGPGAPVAPNAGAGQLAGTTWVGQETLKGFGRLEFRFQNDGQVTMVDKQQVENGTYNVNGTQVTLTFFDGQCVYSGTIRGNTMSGTARNPEGVNWTWSVQKQ